MGGPVLDGPWNGGAHEVREVGRLWRRRQHNHPTDTHELRMEPTTESQFVHTFAMIDLNQSQVGRGGL